MKKYLFGSVGVSFIIFLGLTTFTSSNFSNDRSVELGLAEQSPDGVGAGLAIPASGGSPAVTTPGCSVFLGDGSLKNGETTELSWVHGLIDKGTTDAGGANATGNTASQNSTTNTSQTDFADSTGGSNSTQAAASPLYPSYPMSYVPVNEPIVAKLQDWTVRDACLVYCDLDRNTCDPNVTSQWNPVNIQNGMLAFKSAESEENLFANIPGIAYASGGGVPTCPSTSQANSRTKSFQFTANKRGNYIIGMKPMYYNTYGGHHTAVRSAICTTQISIDAAAKPELSVTLPIDGRSFGLGSDIPLDALIHNTGFLGTDYTEGGVNAVNNTSSQDDTSLQPRWNTDLSGSSGGSNTTPVGRGTSNTSQSNDSQSSNSPSRSGTTKSSQSNDNSTQQNTNSNSRTQSSNNPNTNSNSQGAGLMLAQSQQSSSKSGSTNSSQSSSKSGTTNSSQSNDKQPTNSHSRSNTSYSPQSNDNDSAWSPVEGSGSNYHVGPEANDSTNTQNNTVNVSTGLFRYTTKLILNINPKAFQNRDLIPSSLEFNNMTVDDLGGNRIFTSDLVGPIAQESILATGATWSGSEVKEGTHAIQVCADSTNEIDEVQEGNNCAIGVFRVTENDLVAYTQRTVRVFGQPLSVQGWVTNNSLVPINDGFNNQFTVRDKNDPSNSITLDGSTVYSIGSGGTLTLGSQSFDHEFYFGNIRNLEYQLWVDSGEVIPESDEDNNYSTDIVNLTEWSDLVLVDPDVRPEIVDKSDDSYIAVFDESMEPSFTVHIINETEDSAPITQSFDSVLAIDIDGDCTDSSTHTSTCIDEVKTFTTSNIVGNYAESIQNTTWLPTGEYRVQVFADSSDDLDETDETNNKTGWLPFKVDPSTVVFADPTITVQPPLVRAGDEVTITWDAGGRPDTMCTLSNSVQNADSTSATTAIDRPQNMTIYKITCGDGAIAEDTVSVTSRVEEN